MNGNGSFRLTDAMLRIEALQTATWPCARCGRLRSVLATLFAVIVWTIATAGAFALLRACMIDAAGI